MQALRFLLRYRGRRLYLVTLAGAVSGAASALLVAVITASLSSSDGRSRVSSFIALVAGVLVTGYISRMLSLRLTQETSHDLRMQLCSEILATPLRECEEIGRDKLLATLLEDIQAITQALMSLPNASISAALVLGCLIFLGWLSLPVLCSLVVFILLAMASIIIPERRAQRYFRLAREDWNRLFARIRDLIEGEKELRVHQPRRSAFLSQFLSEAATAVRDRRIQSEALQARIASWFQVIYLIYIGILLYALPGVEQRDLIGYTLALLFIRQPLTSLVGLAAVLNQAGVALENLKNMGLRLAAATQPEPPTLLPPASCGSLHLAGIQHTYYRDSEDRSFTLGPLDLEVRAGEVTFITGGNGSGKTTLVKLISGLYVPEGGHILLDGREVAAPDREWYRQHFSVVFSDFHLFDRLIGLTSADIDERAQGLLARLQLAHKVKIQDGVLSTRAVSQGQRKRLALMTAFLEDRPIYMFDEWAADQDPAFKRFFYHDLLPELRNRGKMVIVVTHDDLYFDTADHIVRLDSGQVVGGKSTKLALG